MNIFLTSEPLNLKMAVMSVQICVGLKVLKNWGLHPINELATLAEVFRQFSEQDMEGCYGFLFPSDLKDQGLECFIASSSSGPLQSSFPSGYIVFWQVFKVCNSSQLCICDPFQENRPERGEHYY